MVYLHHKRNSNTFGKYCMFMFRKKLKFFVVFAVFALLTTLLILKFYDDFNDLSREEKLKTINDLISFKSSRQVCTHPYLPVNSPELDRFLKHVERVNCSAAPVEWVTVKESTCIITDEAKRQFGEITCTFTDIIRISDFELEDGKSTVTTDTYKLVNSDVVRVKCKSESGEHWHSTLIGVRDDNDITYRLMSTRPNKNSLPINVLIFGYDSMSKNSFIRKLPKTYKYLTEDLKAVVLEDYNIVGDGTPQALIPILTGKNELELPDTRKRVVHSQFVNTYPFIWNNFRDNGYVTAFLEDTPSTGIFTYRLKGFKEIPTDHYMRPYYLAAEPLFKESPAWCAGRTPRHSVMMNFITQFFMKYKNVPKFLFGFHGELSHDDYNLIEGADDDTVAWLKEMKSLGIFNNTLFVFMADHGNRFAEVRNTLQGKQEERLPFFSFVVPDSLKQQHKVAYDNLVKNMHRLATPFDIHASLSHLLDWRNFGMGDAGERAISLFNEIPKHRTCADAFIEPHWCACLEWKNLSVATDVALKVATTVIQAINDFTQEERDKCSKLYLASVEWLHKLVPNDFLLTFHKNHDTDGYIADFKAKNNMKDDGAKNIYQIKLIVKPSQAIYEASVSHDTKENDFNVKISDISRVNKYGDQAKCIYDTSEHLRKYCYCDGA